MAEPNPDIVNPDHVADVWPAAAPAEDPVLYGQAKLTPEGACVLKMDQVIQFSVWIDI